MKINPAIMSFAMAHPILSTILGLGTMATTAYTAKQFAPVAGKALDLMIENVRHGKHPLEGLANIKKAGLIGEHDGEKPSVVPENLAPSQP